MHASTESILRLTHGEGPRTQNFRSPFCRRSGWFFRVPSSGSAVGNPAVCTPRTTECANSPARSANVSLVRRKGGAVCKINQDFFLLLFFFFFFLWWEVVFVCVLLFLFLVAFLQLYCPSRIPPIGNFVCLPRGKPTATESHVTQSTVHAGCFSVSTIHRTLTWNTGSLTCAHMQMHAIAHGGAWTP